MCGTTSPYLSKVNPTRQYLARGRPADTRHDDDRRNDGIAPTALHRSTDKPYYLHYNFSNLSDLYNHVPPPNDTD
jgi:hypothetical protein